MAHLKLLSLKARSVGEILEVPDVLEDDDWLSSIGCSCSCSCACGCTC